jgi:hypothetical protein
MVFPQAKDNLFFYKGVSLLVAFLGGFSLMIELIWPGSIEIITSEKVVRPQDSLAYYSALGCVMLVSLAALALFWWLHQRVRRVEASESGLQILIEPLNTVSWLEVRSVKKALIWFLNGFYLVSLADGTEFYTPIEHEPPSFSTLITWYDAPILLKQLCIKKGVWVN